MTDARALQVRSSYPLRRTDLDDLGHLNQAVYHELMEDARARFVAQLGAVEGYASSAARPTLARNCAPAQSRAFVLARIELDYRREVTMDDGGVDVVTRAESVGRSSIVLGHRVVLADDTVCAEGRAVMVAWDAAERRARPLTDAERAALAPGERGPGGRARGRV